MRTHLASWVHLGCIPLGLVLEVDFVPGERRFCLRKRNLGLISSMLAGKREAL